jgi:hypothetical protein
MEEQNRFMVTFSTKIAQTMVSCCLKKTLRPTHKTTDLTAEEKNNVNICMNKIFKAQAIIGNALQQTQGPSPM